VLRRVTAAVAFIALLGASPVARSSLVCRYTGEEMVGCDEERVPEQPLVRDEGCCDRRAVARLPAASAAAHAQLAAPVLAVVAIAPVTVDVFVQRPRAAEDSFPIVGPPLFISARALLI
jgi:hypothetical protein